MCRNGPVFLPAERTVAAVVAAAAQRRVRWQGKARQLHPEGAGSVASGPGAVRGDPDDFCIFIGGCHQSSAWPVMLNAHNGLGVLLRKKNSLALPGAQNTPLPGTGASGTDSTPEEGHAWLTVTSTKTCHWLSPPLPRLPPSDLGIQLPGLFSPSPTLFFHRQYNVQLCEIHCLRETCF